MIHAVLSFLCLRPSPRTSFHHQPEAQHPKSSAVHKLGRPITPSILPIATKIGSGATCRDVPFSDSCIAANCVLSCPINSCRQHTRASSGTSFQKALDQQLRV